MLTKEDIELMYHPDEQPKPVSQLENDNLFTIGLDFYRVIANNAFEVVVKSMNDLHTKYYTLPPNLSVVKWTMKH